jgi:tRNA A37 methylthiotransferase MiaB
LKRAQKLRELSLHRYQSEALRQKDQVKQTLVLKKESRGGAKGLSRDYWPIKFTNDFSTTTPEVSVRITGYEHDAKNMEGVLLGEVMA